MSRCLLMLCLLPACAEIHRSTLDGPGAFTADADVVDTTPQSQVTEQPADAVAPADEPEEVTEEVPETSTTWSSIHATPRLVEGTWLAGQFGGTRAFSGAPTDVDLRIDARSMDVTLHAVDTDWTMLALRVSGQLGQGVFAPGNTVYLSGDAPDAPDAVSGDGTVQGCSGPDQWDWDTDDFTDDVVIEVSVDPSSGELILDVDADFGSNGELSGTLVFE